MIADGSGSTRLVLWQKDVGTMEENRYSISGATVRMINETYCLSASGKCIIDAIPDIGEVEGPVAVERTAAVRGVKGHIVAVLSSEEYAGCNACSCKMKSVGASNIVECEKCGAKMRMENCTSRKVAKVIVVAEESGESLRVTIFDKVLSQMLGGETHGNLAEKLLGGECYRFQIGSNNIVSSAHRI